MDNGFASISSIFLYLYGLSIKLVYEPGAPCCIVRIKCTRDKFKITIYTLQHLFVMPIIFCADFLFEEWRFFVEYIDVFFCQS